MCLGMQWHPYIQIVHHFIIVAWSTGFEYQYHFSINIYIILCYDVCPVGRTCLLYFNSIGVECHHFEFAQKHHLTF